MRGGATWPDLLWRGTPAPPPVGERTTSQLWVGEAVGPRRRGSGKRRGRAAADRRKGGGHAVGEGTGRAAAGDGRDGPPSVPTPPLREAEWHTGERRPRTPGQAARRTALCGRRGGGSGETAVVWRGVGRAVPAERGKEETEQIVWGE